MAGSNQTIAKNFNPFPGLRPFSSEETHLFFGREGQVDEIVGNLKKNRFIAVVGASGSGKSSLINQTQLRKNSISNIRLVV